MSDQLQQEESGQGIASVRALGLILGPPTPKKRRKDEKMEEERK